MSTSLAFLFGVLAVAALVILALGGVLISLAGKELEREDAEENCDAR